MSASTGKYSPIGEELKNAQVVLSQERVHSSSLQHMIRTKDSSRKATTSNGQSSSLDLNKNIIVEENSLGLMGVAKTVSKARIYIGKSRGTDVNLTNNEVLDHLYDCNQHNPSNTFHRSEILQEARKKYFFKDSDTPSWRLVEYQDDNGRTIEEPELFHPIEMDDYTYNE